MLLSVTHSKYYFSWIFKRMHQVCVCFVYLFFGSTQAWTVKHIKADSHIPTESCVYLFFNTCDICLAFESTSTPMSGIRLAVFKFEFQNLEYSSWNKKNALDEIPVDIYVGRLLFQISATSRLLFRCHLDRGRRFSLCKDYCGNVSVYSSALLCSLF